MTAASLARAARIAAIIAAIAGAIAPGSGGGAFGSRRISSILCLLLRVASSWT